MTPKGLTVPLVFGLIMHLFVHPCFNQALAAQLRQGLRLCSAQAASPAASGCAEEEDDRGRTTRHQWIAIERPDKIPRRWKWFQDYHIKMMQDAICPLIFFQPIRYEGINIFVFDPCLG